MAIDQSGGAPPQSGPPHRLGPPDQLREHEAPPVSNAMLGIIIVAVVAALVFGYLFLSKLIDISRQEDCMLAHNKTCAAIERNR
jgi:hypothetical protein